MLVLSIPSPDVTSFEVGPLRITFYALCILAGIVAATVMTSRRLTRRGAEPGVVFDVLIWAVPLGIIGARVYHVLTHPGDYFYPGADPWEVVRIWNGGNAIFGALLGGALGVWIGCRLTGLRFWSFADALAPGLLLAQALGRFGNWFNQELFGLPTDLPWGLEIASDNPAFPLGLPADTLFHPTFLYEIIWNLAGVALILLLERGFVLRWGRALAVYLIWYGIGRTWFESIRIDPSEVFLGVRTNIWAALLAIVVGIVILLVQARRHPGLEPTPYRPGREWQRPEAGVESGDVDEDSDFDGEGADENKERIAATATSDSGAKS